jgi:1-acyl-sn-glycerol-3-phosphate acyltransferase
MPPRAPEGVLVVSNHVSWLDILLVGAVCPGRMLAKREVAGWPVIGRFAVRGGTLFIDRERIRTLPDTVAEIAGALRGGATVVAFPEGSTWCGREEGRFRPAVFQAALDAGVPVRPVSIRYRLAGGEPTTAPAFVGDDTLLASVRRVVATRGLTAELTVDQEIPAGAHADRRALAGAVRRAPAPRP